MSEDEVHALVVAGCDLSDAGDHVGAEACFRQALALGADWVWFNIGNELRDQGRLTAAIDAYDLAEAAGEIGGIRNTGLVLEQLGDLAGAMAAFRRSGEAGDRMGWVDLAMVLREQGEQEQAEVVILNAVVLGEPRAAAVLACWRWDRTHDPALEPDLRAGAPHFDGAAEDLATLLRRTGRVTEAHHVLQQGLASGQEGLQLAMGNLLWDELDDVEGAEAAFRAGIAAGELFCHHNLGRLLEHLDRAEEALAEYVTGSLGGDRMAADAVTEFLEDGWCTDEDCDCDRDEDD